MKRFGRTIVFLVLPFAGSACGGGDTAAPQNNAPVPQWAVAAGGTGQDTAEGVAAADNGDIYVVGYFEGSAVFPDTTLTSTGDYDIFLIKLDATGEMQWIVQAGGTGRDVATGCTVDLNGDLILTGYFANTATFSGANFTSQGGADIFVAKYGANGSPTWLATAGGVENDLGLNVAVNAFGEVLVSGSYRSTAAFGPTNLTSNGAEDGFVWVLNGSAAPLWVHSIGGTAQDYGNGVTTDAGGNVFLVGGFEGTADFGTTARTSRGFNDGFLAAYDRNGGFRWVNQMGGAQGDVAYGVTVANDGSIGVVGAFSDTASFDTYDVISAGGHDAFVARYDATGIPMWVRTVSGVGTDRAFSITAVATDFIVGGTFGGPATFDGSVLAGQDPLDMFLARYTAGGSISWAREYNGRDDQQVRAVAVDRDGNVIAAGRFQTDATVGDDYLSGHGTSLDAVIFKRGPGG